MSNLVPNSFASYELSDTEALQGSILTLTQKQVIQNQLSAIAEEKLGLEFDPDSPKQFIQQEAYKRGQMDILTYILDNSGSCELALYNPASEVNPT